MTASRTSRRPGDRPRMRPRLAMAAAAVGVGAVLALAGCSAGQITQTATQVPPVVGVNLDAGDIALRNLVIAYNGPEGYPAGSDAPLVVRLFNNGHEPVTLVGVSTDKAEAVVLTGAPTVVSPTGSATQPPAPEPTASPTEEASPAPTDTAEPTATPTATPTPTPTTQRPTGEPVSVTIPPQSYVLLVPGESDSGHLVLVGLREAIIPGESVNVTFTFSDGTTVVAPVPLAPPVTAVPRATPVVDPGHNEGH
ncbi:MAG: copper chaperone PCu(A)C [Micromonosporaceae bacterium]|nr:copper chaperone PCu(A)C [Micromonosporaceae bacterium]